MQYSSRLTIAAHILMCIDHFRDTKVTSDFLAASVNVNPVIVRNILGRLKKAGIVKVEAGIGGASLAKQPEEITLLDLFRAVENDDDLFHFHEHPNPACPVGKNVFPVLSGHLQDARTAMENSLRKTTLQDLMNDLEDRLG